MFNPPVMSRYPKRINSIAVALYILTALVCETPSKQMPVKPNSTKTRTINNGVNKMNRPQMEHKSQINPMQ